MDQFNSYTSNSVSEKTHYTKKRSSIFINKYFQVSFLFHFLAIVGCSVGSFYFLGSVLHWGVMASALISGTLLTVGGLYLSFRIAGPLSRLNNYLLRSSNGESIGELHFRNDDYFENLSHSFNLQQSYISKIQDQNQPASELEHNAEVTPIHKKAA